MFNLQGGELMIVLLLALVVLGPEKLPDAMRKLGQFVAQMRKMSSGFQQEFKAAVDEPMREVRKTADMLRDSVDFRKLQDGERAEKPKSAEMQPLNEADPLTQPVEQAAEAAVDVPAEQPVDPVVAAPAAIEEPGVEPEPVGEPEPAIEATSEDRAE